MAQAEWTVVPEQPAPFNAPRMVTAQPKSQPTPSGWTPVSEPKADKKAGTNSALVLNLSAHLVPYVASVLEEFATSPNVPKIAAQAGRVMGGAAPVIGGGIEFGLPGAMVGVAGSAKGAWLGGKTGWHTGKMVQNLSAPVAQAMEKLAPYAQTLATLSGAQGVLDLAQMAEPDRRDIGFMGVGPHVDVPANAPNKNEAHNTQQMRAFLKTPEPPPPPPQFRKETWNKLTSDIRDAIHRAVQASLSGEK